MLHHLGNTGTDTEVATYREQQQERNPWDIVENEKNKAD